MYLTYKVIGYSWDSFYPDQRVLIPVETALQEISPEEADTGQSDGCWENAIVQMATDYPAYGQLRASNELRKKGFLFHRPGYGISGCGMIWRPLPSV